MPNRKIEMEKIKEIVRLSKNNKLSNRAISKSIKVSRTYISYVLKRLKIFDYQTIKDYSEKKLNEICYPRKQENIESLEKLELLFPEINKEIKRTGVTLRLLWEEYKLKNEDTYSYSRFCHYFHQWRNATKVVMHLEHKAGEAMFCDYAGDKLSIFNRLTGEEKRVSTFLSILPSSHLTFAFCTETEKTKDWIAGCQKSFEYFGGVPLGIVPDNAKAVITKFNKYDPKVNPQFQLFAEHYGTSISPARVRKPQDKALVENAVNLIYQRVYAPLRNQKFYSIEELNIEVKRLVDKHNETLMKAYQSTRRKMFEEVEKPTLSSLPEHPYYFRESELRRTVGLNYHVLLKEDNHYYSVPFQLRGEKCTIFYDDKIVEIWLKGRRIGTHVRQSGRNKYTTLSIHMPKSHKEYQSWSPERFNSWAEEIGQFTMIVIQNIFEKEKFPQKSYRIILGLVNLSKIYGTNRLENACKRSTFFDNYSLHSIEEILQKGYDLNSENESTKTFDLPDSENIRGADFYFQQIALN